MRARSNSTAVYIIAILVIIVAFLLLGGGPWINGIFHGNSSIRINNWNWTQILISFGLGFLLCYIILKRK